MAIACHRFNCALTPHVTGGRRSGRCFKVDVLEGEHWNQFLLGTLRESAALYEFSGVLVGPEHSIPERNIAEVIFMDVEIGDVSNAVRVSESGTAANAGFAHWRDKNILQCQRRSCTRTLPSANNRAAG